MLAEALVPTRQIEWNVAPAMVWFVYLSMAVALGVFAYGWWRRIQVWKIGRPVMRTDRLGERFSRMMSMGVLHGSLMRRRFPASCTP